MSDGVCHLGKSGRAGAGDITDILERDCGLQPAAVSRVRSIIDDLRDQIALRVTEAGG